MSALAGLPKASFLARIRAGEMGGVILIGRWRPAELAATTRELHRAGCAAGRPLLVTVDQEGGFARRLTWADPVHTAAELGRLGAAQVRAEAGASAHALRAAGIDLDFAPVTDTLVPGGFLGARSFLTGLLRGAFGFRGLVVSDALDAPRPARTPHAAARALAAGVDLLLYTSSRAAHSGYLELRRDAQASPLLRARLANAVARLRALEAWLGRGC